MGMRDEGHRGRGPKGFARSDERVKERISECLEEHPRIDASEIEIQVKDGEVTLTGTVNDRDQKRLAEDAIENLPGVREVNNQIRVSRQTQGADANKNRGQQASTSGQTSTTPSTTGAQSTSTTGTTGTTGTTAQSQLTKH
jgi:outer membrane protein TolC